MNIYTGLLFNHGHIQDPALARSLAASGDREPAVSPQPGARRRDTAGRGCPPKAFRRGAIASVCSVALSPFR